MSNNTQWFVSYHVKHFNKDIICGPYASWLEATVQVDDIASYEGITNCFCYSENANELLDKALLRD